MKKRLWTLLAAAAVAGLATTVLAACGGSSPSGGGGGAGGTPKKGGTFVISYQSDASSLDPAVAWNVIDWTVEHCIYEGLYKYAPKPGTAGTQVIPAIAEALPTITDGGTTYTIHLRHGVKFQPPVSREVTAQDFKYTFERMMSPKTLPAPPGTSFYMGVVGAADFNAGKTSDIPGFNVVDPYTIQIKLLKPDLSFLNAITMEFCDVVPQEWVKKWGAKFNRHPLGAGPFMLEKWTPGQVIALKANPNYYDSAIVHLDGIKFVLSYDPATAFLKLKAGQVDALGDGVPSADIAQVMADPSLKSQVFTQPLIAISYLFMEVHAKPFDNLKVRQAVSWAVNRDKLVQLQGGQAVPLWQVYPPGMPGHTDEKFYGYDPAKAKELLKEAGYPNGFSTMLYTDNVDPDPKLMQSVQFDLAAVGIKATLKTMSNDVYYQFQATPGKATMGSFGWWMDFPDPSDWVGPLFSKASAVPGGMNSSFWWNPTVEKMYADAQATTDPAARIKKYDEIQTFIMSQAPYATLYAPVQTTMCSKRVGGFFLNPVYQIDPGEYWIK